MFEWLTGRSKKGSAERRESPEDTPDASAQVSADPSRPATEPDVAFSSITSARDSAWNAVGEVDPHVLAPLINPAFTGGPKWPGLRQSFRMVRRDDGIGVITSDGLADPDDDGGSAIGLGVEVYLASTDLATTEVSNLHGKWPFDTLNAVAQTIAGQGVELGPQLERYGALSMSVPGSSAPDEWLDDGAIGVMIGVNLPSVPDTVSVPDGEVLLVGVVPLRPDELARILAEGADARRSIAASLGQLTAAELSAPDRRSVLADPLDRSTATPVAAEPPGSELMNISMAEQAAEFVHDLTVAESPIPPGALDYSRASLKHVDEFLDGPHRTGSALPSKLWGLTSAYVFEVLRQEFGGRYLAGDDVDPIVLVIGEPAFELGVKVMSRVTGRVTNGSEDDLVFFTDGIPPLVAAGRSVTLT